MNKKRLTAVLVVVVLVLSVSLPDFSALEAGEVKKLEIRDSDTIGSLLARNPGMVVELKLRSGESLSGKVTKVLQGMVVLSELTGKEFYDAVIRLDEISAVIFRAREQ